MKTILFYAVLITGLTWAFDSCVAHKKAEKSDVKTELTARTETERQSGVRLHTADSRLRIIDNPRITVETDSSLTEITASRITVAARDSVALQAAARTAVSDSVAVKDDRRDERISELELESATKEFWLMLSLLLNFVLVGHRLLSWTEKSSRL